MRLLGKGKEPARFPRDIRLTVPPRAPRINYYWNYQASNISPRARRGLVTCCCLVLRGGSVTPTDQPAPEFLQRFGLAQLLASHGSIRTGREWNRLDAVAATGIPGPGKLWCS